MGDATISRARCAISRVWAAPAHVGPAEPARPGRPLHAVRPPSMLRASPASCRRAAERPARAPRRAISWLEVCDLGNDSAVALDAGIPGLEGGLELAELMTPLGETYRLGRVEEDAVLVPGDLPGDRD